MGANGSYSKSIGGVSANSRSHSDTGYRIDGHKVLLQNDGADQAKNIMNSNSDSPIYLIGKKQPDGSIEIRYVNIFDGHKLKTEIDLQYDHNGKVLAYNGTDKHTHSHTWVEGSDGNMHRKNGGHEPLPKGYAGLLKDIEKFNYQNKK